MLGRLQMHPSSFLKVSYIEPTFTKNFHIVPRMETAPDRVKRKPAKIASNDALSSSKHCT